MRFDKIKIFLVALAMAGTLLPSVYAGQKQEGERTGAILRNNTKNGDVQPGGKAAQKKGRDALGAVTAEGQGGSGSETTGAKLDASYSGVVSCRSRSPRFIGGVGVKVASCKESGGSIISVTAAFCTASKEGKLCDGNWSPPKTLNNGATAISLGSELSAKAECDPGTPNCRILIRDQSNLVKNGESLPGETQDNTGDGDLRGMLKKGYGNPSYRNAAKLVKGQYSECFNQTQNAQKDGMIFSCDGTKSTSIQRDCQTTTECLAWDNKATEYVKECISYPDSVKTECVRVTPEASCQSSKERMDYTCKQTVSVRTETCEVSRNIVEVSCLSSLECTKKGAAKGCQIDADSSYSDFVVSAENTGEGLQILTVGTPSLRFWSGEDESMPDINYCYGKKGRPLESFNNVYTRSITFDVTDVNLINEFMLASIEFEDHIVIKVNDKAVFSAPYPNGDTLYKLRVGALSTFTHYFCYKEMNKRYYRVNKFGVRFIYGYQLPKEVKDFCYPSDAGKTFRYTPKIDLKPFLRNGRNTITVLLGVGRKLSTVTGYWCSPWQASGPYGGVSMLFQVDQSCSIFCKDSWSDPRCEQFVGGGS